MSKYSSVIGYAAFLFLHLFFIGQCIYSFERTNGAVVLFLVILALVIYSYSFLFRDQFKMKGKLFEFLALVIGSLLTFYLNKELGWGGVIASEIGRASCRERV